MKWPDWIQSETGPLKRILKELPSVFRNVLVTALFLTLAFFVSRFLIGHTGGENNSALVFVLALVLISMMTEGYLYGIAASIIGAFCINIFFMYPFSVFSLKQVGYPVTFLSMVAISIMVCAITTRLQKVAEDAVQRENQTRLLYEQNQKLSEEKTAIEIQSAQETIRSNILQAVSHDLRTPLTGISGTVSVLLASPGFTPDQETMLQNIKEDADSLITMVENLLSVTRLEDGRVPLKKRDEMLEEVAGAAIQAVRRRFPDSNVTLNLSEDILYLPMEPLLIRQVMVNLVENALRHSGEPESVSMTLSRKEDWAVVEVRDHGKGLSEEVLEAVREWRPLKVGDNPDSTRGMGIGLSVCQSIIRAHEGFFEASNAPDGGAIFRFGLRMGEEPYQ